MCTRHEAIGISLYPSDVDLYAGLLQSSDDLAHALEAPSPHHPHIVVKLCALADEVAKNMEFFAAVDGTDLYAGHEFDVHTRRGGACLRQSERGVVVCQRQDVDSCSRCKINDFRRGVQAVRVRRMGMEICDS